MPKIRITKRANLKTSKLQTMLEVIKEGIVLSKFSIGFEDQGVLNPGIILYKDYIHMFYRAVGKGNYSTIGYAKFKNPLEIVSRMDVPIIFPQFDYEEQGVEDPRIVCIDQLFYLSYSAYDGVNALGALATSSDLITWDKKGIIVPQIMFDQFKRLAGTKSRLNQKYFRYNEHEGVKEKNQKKVMIWDKNVLFFPRRINCLLYFLHRIKPDIQIVCVKDLSDLTTDFWQNYLLHFRQNIVLSPKYKHEISYIGGGCPPIETKYGWLLIYHGVYDTIKGFVYCACAALLALEKPEKELARLPYPLFKPELDWELKGEVNNVCFPTGAVVIADKLYIYYGAADERIACASLSFTKLLSELMLNKK